jgi:hypothetical protein
MFTIDDNCELARISICYTERLANHNLSSQEGSILKSKRKKGKRNQMTTGREGSEKAYLGHYLNRTSSLTNFQACVTCYDYNFLLRGFFQS